MEEIRESRRLTRGSWWHLFVFWFAVFGIFSLGLIACGAGVLVSLPVIMISSAYVCRSLLVAAEVREQDEVAAPQPQE